MKDRKLVLFVCVENACRSQMAEAFFNRMTKGLWRAESCGTKLANSISPKTVKAMKEVGIDISTQIPKKFKK